MLTEGPEIRVMLMEPENPQKDSEGYEFWEVNNIGSSHFYDGTLIKQTEQWLTMHWNGMLINRYGYHEDGYDSQPILMFPTHRIAAIQFLTDDDVVEAIDGVNYYGKIRPAQAGA